MPRAGGLERGPAGCARHRVSLPCPAIDRSADPTWACNHGHRPCRRHDDGRRDRAPDPARSLSEFGRLGALVLADAQRDHPEHGGHRGHQARREPRRHRRGSRPLAALGERRRGGRSWDRLGRDDPLVRRAVAGYLTACSLASANRHAAAIAAADPDRWAAAVRGHRPAVPGRRLSGFSPCSRRSPPCGIRPPRVRGPASEPRPRCSAHAGGTGLTGRRLGMPPIRLLGPQSLATGWWRTAPSRR